MVADDKNALAAALDLPPSYDHAVTPGPSEGSSSAPSAPRAPPKESLVFFQAPEHAEPLFGQRTTPEDILADIKFTMKGKHLVTCDARLQNPNVLYDWIRYRALQQPNMVLHCSGRHYEVPERDETVTDRDGVRSRRKGQPEQIVDFDFTVDLGSVYKHPDNTANIHIDTVRSDRPTARGTHELTYAASYSQVGHRDLYAPLLGPVDAGAVADSSYISICKEWVPWRLFRGLPPWKRMEDTVEFWEQRGKGKHTARIALRDDGFDPEADTRLDGDDTRATLKQWCEKYTSDPSWLKSFVVPIWLWGWNLEALQTAIEGAIKSTGYNSNDVKVQFELEQIVIEVHPPNLLSRAVNTTWVYVLLWMTLLYPLVWIWQRMHTLGGGPYQVSSINYGLKFYPPLPSTFPSETIEAAQDRLGGMYKLHSELPKPAQLAYGPLGVHYLLGRKEGEWFREWEERIRMGVRMRYRGALEGGGEEEAGAGLDGY
ncbi:hypothetical protein BD324DRAFT_618014 [Kockovaella imperatae]|uniref:Uncharacterized protein n=1 Tax=Kockovaella imperatae TaxID=4999 RepID=A0A1Y1UNA1_9TREE|nr:hypothetical protein BD324DRAFT_618014 [Kockovaella imperatae]ORX38964.1 hypothetical protein BD324DRAFT_618014 [Kockovaella imperatae]